MNLHMSRQLLTGLALAGTFAFVAACSGPSSSMNPTSPSAMSGASSGANFSPNPDPGCGGEGQPPCEPPPPEGTPCSPGYWKNHETEFDSYCAAAAALPGDPFTTCLQLETAITCKGSDASCGRHLAAAALNTVSGCTEDD